MGIIFPFRNARGPNSCVPCELCDESITPGGGYAVLDSNRQCNGYVCYDCFEIQFDNERKVSNGQQQ